MSVNKIAVIENDIFPLSVVVGLGVPANELMVKCGEHYPINNDEMKAFITDLSCDGFAIILACGAIALWTRHFPDTPEHIGTLIHEIFHAVDSTLRRKGLSMKLSNNTQEVWAHLIEWLTKEIFEKFKLLDKSAALDH